MKIQNVSGTICGLNVDIFHGGIAQIRGSTPTASLGSWPQSTLGTKVSSVKAFLSILNDLLKRASREYEICPSAPWKDGGIFLKHERRRIKMEALQLHILMTIKPSTVKSKSNSRLFVAVFRIYNTLFFFIMCLNKEYWLTWKGFEMWRGKHGNRGQQHCCLKRTRINLQIYKFGLVPVHKGFIFSREKYGNNVYTYNILLSLL